MGLGTGGNFVFQTGCNSLLQLSLIAHGLIFGTGLLSEGFQDDSVVEYVLGVSVRVGVMK